jgi:hypothetical protein
MRPAFAAALGVVAVTVAAVSAHDGPHTGPTDQTYKVAKDGRVKVSEDLTVGETIVKRGTYMFAHRIDEQQHVVTLTPADVDAAKQGGIELRMRLLPSRTMVRRTAILAREAGSRSLTMTTVQVAGEDGEHVLELVRRGE